MIGTLRRDCLDLVVIFVARHLHRILTAYSHYYNERRTHLSLDKDAPLGRAVHREGPIAAANSIRPASLLCADMIFAKDRPSLGAAKKHDHKAGEKRRVDRKFDEALEESFPGSDPVSISQPKLSRGDKDPA